MSKENDADIKKRKHNQPTVTFNYTKPNLVIKARTPTRTQPFPKVNITPEFIISVTQASLNDQSLEKLLGNYAKRYTNMYGMQVSDIQWQRSYRDGSIDYKKGSQSSLLHGQTTENHHIRRVHGISKKFLLHCYMSLTP